MCIYVCAEEERFSTPLKNRVVEIVVAITRSAQKPIKYDILFGFFFFTHTRAITAGFASRQ